MTTYQCVKPRKIQMYGGDEPNIVYELYYTDDYSEYLQIVYTNKITQLELEIKELRKDKLLIRLSNLQKDVASWKSVYELEKVKVKDRDKSIVEKDDRILQLQTALGTTGIIVNKQHDYIDKLIKQLEAERDNVSTSAELKIHLQADIIRLAGERKDLAQTIRDLKDEETKNKAIWDKELADLRTDKTNLTNEKNQLIVKRDNLTSSYKKLINHLANARQLVSHLQNDLSATQQDKAHIQQELNDALAILNKPTAEMGTQTDLTAEQISQMETQITQYQAQITQEQSKVQEKETELANLQGEIKSLREKIKDEVLNEAEQTIMKYVKDPFLYLFGRYDYLLQLKEFQEEHRWTSLRSEYQNIRKKLINMFQLKKDEEDLQTQITKLTQDKEELQTKYDMEVRSKSELVKFLNIYRKNNMYAFNYMTHSSNVKVSVDEINTIFRDMTAPVYFVYLWSGENIKDKVFDVSGTRDEWETGIKFLNITFPPKSDESHTFLTKIGKNKKYKTFENSWDYYLLKGMGIDNTSDDSRSTNYIFNCWTEKTQISWHDESKNILKIVASRTPFSTEINH